MAADELLRQALVSLQVNEDCTEATLIAADGSRLCFCHRVGERWARATPTDGATPSQAERVLAAIQRFRLNGKHLDVLFTDGSSWQAPFR